MITAGPIFAVVDIEHTEHNRGVNIRITVDRWIGLGCIKRNRCIKDRYTREERLKRNIIAKEDGKKGETMYKTRLICVALLLLLAFTTIVQAETLVGDPNVFPATSWTSVSWWDASHVKHERIRSQRMSVSVDGYLRSMTVYLKRVQADEQAKCAVYSSAGAFIEASEEKVISSTTGYWVTFSFSGTTLLSGGTLYHFAVYADAPDVDPGTKAYVQIAYISSGLYYYQDANNYGTWTDPCTFSYTSGTYSLYVTIDPKPTLTINTNALNCTIDTDSLQNRSAVTVWANVTGNTTPIFYTNSAGYLNATGYHVTGNRTDCNESDDFLYIAGFDFEPPALLIIIWMFIVFALIKVNRGYVGVPLILGLTQFLVILAALIAGYYPTIILYLQCVAAAFLLLGVYKTWRGLEGGK